MTKPRMLSFSEIDTALTCTARWDYAYGGRLAGDTLKSRAVPALLSDGRAWGAAVATWHATGDPWAAHAALHQAFTADEEAMAERGVTVPVEVSMEARARLAAILSHYMQTATRLPNLTRIEQEVIVALPSRTGSRRSGRYRFLCYLDGYTDDDGQRWLVEFKLRNRLSDARAIQLGRQVRWYAWALGQATYGPPPLGVLVDERLNEAPKPPRVVKGRRKGTPMVPSHAKDQVTTPEAYVDLCVEMNEPPDDDVIAALAQRRWQARTPLLFRRGELEEAGRELVSAAKLIRDLDSGELTPIRHAHPMRCSGCRYRDICADPEDRLYVDSLFVRTVPKRLRPDLERTAA